MLSGEFEHGWLTFESATSLRRCTPIPRGWETAAPDRLELYCRAGTETRRQTPSTGTPVVDEEESTSGGDARP
jgi:hypothetical protein